MKHCIYFKKTEPEATFLSEEHIFPAGIGGKKKLPQEYVSHDCNNAFSSMELEFMRNSIISIPRQFYGPGNEGN
ncbi:HNH endonuclease [Peribacillus muralis]|uniref:HNH endonuclease n=1 Tax=Peribacillus muralis TaxID=264697 RepID=UPI00070E0465|nr:HNH endonuclease [Peribacillus muralis]